MSNMFACLPDSSLQANYDLLSRSLCSNPTIINQQNSFSQLLGSSYPVNNPMNQIHALKRGNQCEMDLQLAKKLRSSQMNSQPLDWTMTMNSLNSNKTSAFLNNLSQNPYESQYVQNQLPFELIQSNSLLNLNQNNLLRNLALPNQRTSSQQLISVSPQANISLESLYQQQYNLNQLDLAKQQFQLQQQLQQQQQQQQLQLLLQQQQQQLLLDIGSLNQYVNIDELNQTLQNQYILNSGNLMMMNSGQLLQLSQPTLNIPTQQAQPTYIQSQNSYLYKNVNELMKEKEVEIQLTENICVSQVKNFAENIQEISETSTKLSEGSRSEEEKEYDEFKPTPVKKIRTPKIRNFTLDVTKSPEVSSPEDSTKNGGRRLNRWQQSQGEKEKDFREERIRLINEVPCDFAAQKVLSTPIGPNNQTDIPSLGSMSLRAMKKVWNPSNVSVETLEQFLFEVEQFLGLIDQQKCLRLLAEKEGNVVETLSLIKAEKKKYINQFSIKPKTKKFFL